MSCSDGPVRRLTAPGWSLLVGSAGADGTPHASRAWGAELAEDGRLRVVVDAHDTTVLDHLSSTRTIAVTSADVRTLEALQVKGEVVSLDQATAEDLAIAHRYVDALFDAIFETDGVPHSVLHQMVPAAYVACTIEVHEAFDQTPGPRAGRPVEEGAGGG